MAEREKEREREHKHLILTGLDRPLSTAGIEYIPRHPGGGFTERRETEGERDRERQRERDRERERERERDREREEVCEGVKGGVIE